MESACRNFYGTCACDNLIGGSSFLDTQILIDLKSASATANRGIQVMQSLVETVMISSQSALPLVGQDIFVPLAIQDVGTD